MIPSLVAKCLSYCNQVTVCHFHLTIDCKNKKILLNISLTAFEGDWGGIATLWGEGSPLLGGVVTFQNLR